MELNAFAIVIIVSSVLVFLTACLGTLYAAYDMHERHKTIRELLKAIQVLENNGQSEDAKKLRRCVETMKP